MRADPRRHDARALFVAPGKARAFALKGYGTTALKALLSKAIGFTLGMTFHFNASLWGQPSWLAIGGSSFFLPIEAAVLLQSVRLEAASSILPIAQVNEAVR
jgi:hypothetical protein